jgi:hypothetical protein
MPMPAALLLASSPAGSPEAGASAASTIATTNESNGPFHEWCPPICRHVERCGTTLIAWGRSWSRSGFFPDHWTWATTEWDPWFYEFSICSWCTNAAPELSTTTSWSKVTSLRISATCSEWHATVPVTNDGTFPCRRSAACTIPHGPTRSFTASHPHSPGRHVTS